MFRRSPKNEDLVGFAFSGGGTRAACQVGALKALTEAGVWPQMVAGTSAGAVNATRFALFPHRLDRLEAIWLALRTQDVFPGNRFHMLMNFARRGYIHRADAWESFLRAEVGEARFEDLAIPCAVVAVRLRDGRREVFDSGPVVPALMASTAIPGMFPPYRIGDELYVDGGVLEYMPVPALLERGVSTVYALDCSWIEETGPLRGSPVDRCGRISARAAVDQLVSLPATRGTTVHVLRPELPDLDDGRDFRRTAEMILSGYVHARDFLQARGLTQGTPADSAPTAG